MTGKLAIILIGPQGSGKGTQATILCKTYNMTYISSGNITRALAKRQDTAGNEARKLMDEGTLLPDRLINAELISLVNEVGRDESVLFDGYPRTIAQADFLTAYLHSEHYKTMAIVLELDDKTSISRIQKRLVCRECGKVAFSLPANDLTDDQTSRLPAHVCVYCGGALIQRTDDTEESVKKRLAIYHKETEPVIDFYQKQGALFRIDAKPSIPDVAAQIDKLLKGERV